jgi:hypothetical protein
LDLEEECRVTAVGFLISKSLSKAELECLRRYELMHAISTFCIVGLPYFESSWFSSDSTLELVLCYSTSTVENSFHKVSNIDFLRLLTPGCWIDSSIINWYGRFLSQSCLPGVNFMPCDIFDKLLLGFDGEDGMSAIDKYHGPFEEGRYVYPCFWANHFTLSVLDVSKSRARLASIDSLDWHEDDIRQAWKTFFEHRNLPRLSMCTLNGGQQLDNATECGAFVLLNMDAIVKQVPFFEIKSWNKEAHARNCLPGGTCQVARKRYASLLRHQCLQWFRDKTAVHLHSNVYIPPKSESFVQIESDDDTVAPAAGKANDKREAALSTVPLPRSPFRPPKRALARVVHLECLTHRTRHRLPSASN